MIAGKSITISVSADFNVASSPPRETAVLLLTRGLARGDEHSFRKFYDLYSHRLFAYLFVVCHGNESQARDILQQTFIKVARNARPFDNEEIFWKWLAAIARNLWIDETRKHTRYVGALERFFMWRSRDVETRVEQSADDEIQSALESLEGDERALLQQKYYEGRSLREIAEGLSISEKGVESRLTRARNKLKSVLGASRNENAV